MKTHRYQIDELRLDATHLPFDRQHIDANLAGFIAAKLGVAPEEIRDYRIGNKSVDARRGMPELIYSLVVETAEAQPELKPGNFPETVEFFVPDNRAIRHPLIIGAGPAGLFAAYALALAGCRPIVLERGFDVDRRTQDIAVFEQTRVFNPESNYLYGEGGAGTFSDGKLYTRIRDPRCKLVLETLIACGAPTEIGYLKRPHLGSDKLPGIIRNLREKIIAAGGEFHFGTHVTDLEIVNNRFTRVKTAQGEWLEAPLVILAHGLGGRDLTLNAVERGVAFMPKGFQIGCRIEHPQLLIDQRQYRVQERPCALGASEYHISSRGEGAVPGVSSFCMCPGGEVVMGAGAPQRLATNGMSRYARDGRFANAGLIVTLDAADFATPRLAYDFLDSLEAKAFQMGGGDYTFPAQDAAAFLQKRAGLTRRESSTAFGLQKADLRTLFPAEFSRGLERALPHFDRLLKGFVREGVLIGLESCVSSPVRLLRNDETQETSVPNLYAAGEGAGYAGGIISAAVDGLKVAMAILSE